MRKWVTMTSRPPTHLKPATRKWWLDVTRTFQLEPHHIRLLTLATEAWDRGQEARQALSQSGLTYTDRLGVPRARPEVAIERDARIAFARLLRELNLDVSSPAEAYSRPPELLVRKA